MLRERLIQNGRMHQQESWFLFFDKMLHPARTSQYGLDWLEAICTKAQWL
jgi:hypothetical protein